MENDRIRELSTSRKLDDMSNDEARLPAKLDIHEIVNRVLHSWEKEELNQVDPVLHIKKLHSIIVKHGLIVIGQRAVHVDTSDPL